MVSLAQAIATAENTKQVPSFTPGDIGDLAAKLGLTRPVLLTQLINKLRDLPPRWSSGNNAVLTDNCQALDDVTVSLEVSQDLVTAGNSGFALQLNAYPMPGVTVVGNKTLNWIQFILFVSNNQATWNWQAWCLGRTDPEPTDPQGTSDPQQVVPPFPNPPSQLITPSVPSNQLLNGSSLIIALTTDPSHAITAATFTVELAGAAPQSATLNFPASIPFKDRQGNPGVVDAQFPIGGFQVNLVDSRTGSKVTFNSGAGQLTYSVPLGRSLSVQNGGVGAACGQFPGANTGEQSNIVYHDVSLVDGDLSQPFDLA
jgi:hypothetical protein